MYHRISNKIKTDVLVIGAGLAGVCAAIQAARLGSKVVLLEKFRTLGGNSGPEVGVHPSGAHRFHPYAVETGVVEELIEEAAWRRAKTASYMNHYNISQMWDGVLNDKLEEAGVTVLRCHYAKEPVVENKKIVRVIVEDIATYHTREITVEHIVIDASGDGNISAKAGAEFRMGRESASEYGERSAPEKSDSITLGSSLVGYIRKSSENIPFSAPPGTPAYQQGYEHTPEEFPEECEAVFVYPTETGGENTADSIEDDHEIYKTLLDQMYSWWNMVKNTGSDNEKWELVWVSPRVAKRESRRFKGAYTLTQTDVENGIVFPDAIGFGGFAEDLHYPRPENEQYIHIEYVGIPPLYSIPYRCLYSKDIDNLMFASRLMSVSHIAHGTVRVQRTLATCGMAAGAAAALCGKLGCLPADLYRTHLELLQQTMMEEDASIMGCENRDPDDIARKATITADSEKIYGVRDFENFLPLDRVRGVMLWDWADRLERFWGFFRNSSDVNKTLRAVLRRYSKKNTYKFNSDFKKFSYHPIANQMEWGADDCCDGFVALAESTVQLPAGFCGWVDFPFDVRLTTKNPYNDEERYLVELLPEDGVEWAHSGAYYDFCRRAERQGRMHYSTFADSHAFDIVPAPRYGEASNVADGVARRWSTNPVHMWMAGDKQLPQSLTLEWDSPQAFAQVHIKFDSLKRSYRQMPLDCQQRVCDLLVKHYTVEVFDGNDWVQVAEVDDNYRRFNKIEFDTVTASKLRINVLEMWGDSEPRIYEVRVY